MKTQNYILDMSLIKKGIAKSTSIQDLNDFFKEVSISKTQKTLTSKQLEFAEDLLKSFWIFTRRNKKRDELLEELYNIVCEIQKDKTLCIITFSRMCGIFLNHTTKIFNPESVFDSIPSGKSRMIELTTSG